MQKTTIDLKTQAVNGKQAFTEKRNMELMLLALPAIIYIFIFKYLPMGGVILAFKEYSYVDGILGSKFIGWKNFEFFFRSDAAFFTTFNTLFYNFIFIVLGTLLNIIVALLLNEVRNRKAIKFYQTVMFFPHFLSWVVVSFILYGFLSNAYGILNQIMIMIGLQPQNWYQYPTAWRFILVGAYLWKGMGMGVLITYAVLIGIDRSYYEAAEIDGANKMQMVFHISLPFLIPITLIQFILSIGNIFRADFGLFYQLPQGSGTLEKVTSVIDTYVFRMLMDSNEVGIGAAIGLFQSVVGLVLIVTTNAIVKRIEADNALF